MQNLERGEKRMFRIAICDDEKIFRDDLKEILIRYMTDRGIMLEIDTFSSGKEFVELGIEMVKYKITWAEFDFCEGTRKVSLNRILYIESKLHKLEFHVMEDCLQKYTLQGTLNEIDDKFAGNDFLRIHQSFLVNMKFIKNISRYRVLLNNGILLDIARARYKYVEEKFIAYRGEV